jgi:uncharacterized protein YbjT (DUF2867 family)
MRVAVVGATGVLGRHVVPRLIERGHDVRPIVRTDEHVRRFQGLGISAVRGDILDAASLGPAIRGVRQPCTLRLRFRRQARRRTGHSTIAFGGRARPTS